MPALRKNNQSSSDDGTPSSTSPSPSPSKGWTKEQKRQLFYHVMKKGERDWGNAVDGKTGHQKNTLTSNYQSLWILKPAPSHDC
ncbi:hypothetical protein I203_107178 [Kwoniella mangroviensis CBS 8507]|uniref:hypothetical protein n=1 Tax=Kwoniella mangroviensis CBS 8507 TaxID=1296122 RepID=UPI00080D7012|nr:uncharacterized protein I203_01925 [Kwoniella mangroviensis CBS 8507]OCF68542.1 hypothetical protein I203_01925 [Kwoniella mangroviensis CBS 8507]